MVKMVNGKKSSKRRKEEGNEKNRFSIDSVTRNRKMKRDE